MLPIGGFYTIDPPKAAVLANYISPHTVVPLHYSSLLGGKCAPDKFRSVLRADITADIRPNVYSRVMISMYAKAAAAFAALILLEILLLRCSA